MYILAIMPIHSQTIVENETITITTLGNNNYSLSNNAELRITNPSPSPTGSINFISDSGWLILEGIKPTEVIANHLNYIKVNGQIAIYKTNIRVTNYLSGSVIMPHSENFAALTAYTNANFLGSTITFEPETYYKSAQLGSFENTLSSFRLEKGYMATFAENENGTGASKVFIADKNTIEINLPAELNNNVSFVRVFPWRYSTKKGMGSGADFNREARVAKELNASWYYDWRHEPTSATEADLIDIEYVPMKWNARVADLDTDTRWNTIANLTGVNHLLGFNEFDSASHANMEISEMIEIWPKMMESGLRLGSPAPAGIVNGELIEFIKQCDELNYRVDFIAIHLYNRFTDAQAFYDKVKYVYDNTGQRPIWITEFNHGGHWMTEDPTISYQEMSNKVKDVIERLEQEGIVERYAIFSMEQDWVNKAVFFPPNETDYIDITPLGQTYKDHVSSMAYKSESETNEPPVLQNVVLNKPVTASSQHNDYAPENAVDSIISASSRWLVRFTSNPLPASLEVDLQGNYTIYSYNLYESGNSRDFNFEYWNDTASSWVVADAVVDNPDGNDYSGTFVNPITTNRVRLTITKHNRTDYIRMYEFQVFGVPSQTDDNEDDNGNPPETLNETVTLCQGETILLTAPQGDNYLWNNGQTSQSISVNPNSTSSFTVTTTNTAGSSISTFTVNVTPTPVANAGADITINNGESVTLSASGGTSYLWNTGVSSANIIVAPSETTTYTVTATTNSCSSQDQVVVTVINTDNQECTNINISNDDFESGWGIWNDGGSDARRSSKDATFANGKYCVRVRDNSSTSNITSDVLNLAGYEEVSVNFTFYFSEVNAGDSFSFQISKNGGASYTTYKSWTVASGFPNNQFHTDNVVVSDAFTNATQFRFLGSFNSNSNRVYLDDIIINGCTIAQSKQAGTKTELLEENNSFKTNTNLGIIYPNPVKDNFKIKLENSYKNASIHIMNMLGQNIMSKEFTNNQEIIILTTNLKRGNYFVKMSIDNITKYQKIIKE